MQFSFIIERSSFIFNRIVINAERVNRRIQIFENIFFNDSLHDLNSFISSFIKRVLKRFLNDITTDVNNKSSKTFKNAEKRFSNKKNQFHSIKNSRVDFYATFYIFFLRCFHKLHDRFETNDDRVYNFFFFTFFSSFSFFFSTFFFFFRSIFFVFDSKREKK